MLQIHNKEIDTLKKKIEDNKKTYQIEESNYNRVSLIKQQDKEINDAKIKIEELEMKLLYVKKQLNAYKTTSINTNMIDLDTSHLENKSLSKVNNNNNISSETISNELLQCVARIGRKRYKFDTLSIEEQNTYPSNVFISKSGYILGKSCPLMVKSRIIFCEEHSDGFENITLKPYREKRKTNIEEVVEEEVVEEEVVEENKQEEVVEEKVVEENKQEDKKEEVVEITDLPTFDDIDMYESDDGTSYYEDMREQYKGYLYEITEDEEIGAFVKINN